MQYQKKISIKKKKKKKKMDLLCVSYVKNAIIICILLKQTSYQFSFDCASDDSLSSLILRKENLFAMGDFLCAGRPADRGTDCRSVHPTNDDNDALKQG